MDKLIEFFENKCLEPKLYWRIKSEDSSETFELEWHRDRRTKWHLRKLAKPGGKENDWVIFNSEQLEAQLIAYKIDLDETRSKIKSTTLQQVVFAKMMYDEALSFFGEDTVAAAIEETHAFLDQLRFMVSDMIEGDDGLDATSGAQPKKADSKKSASIRLVKP